MNESHFGRPRNVCVECFVDLGDSPEQLCGKYECEQYHRLQIREWTCEQVNVWLLCLGIQPRCPMDGVDLLRFTRQDFWSAGYTLKETEIVLKRL